MAKLLMIVSSARTIRLADGGNHPTGYRAKEVRKPHEAFVAAGVDVVIATPDGKVPQPDPWGLEPSSDLSAKIKVLSTKDIYFGGTLFEKYVRQGRFDDFRRFCQLHSCRHIEVSNGTIPMSNSEKASYIRKLADDFTVVSEVGFKDPVRSEQLPPSMWVEYISEDLGAGASLVTLEARESGKSGICRPDGALRFGLIEDVLASGMSQDRLLFEAPTTSLQAYFVTRLGPDVNLGNVPVPSVIALETLRLGLRADTLTAFE